MKKTKTYPLLLTTPVCVFICTILNPAITPVLAKTSTNSSPLALASSPNFQMLPCKQEKSLKSKSGKAININFINNTGSAVRLYWLDFTGKRVSYSSNLPTSVTHQQPTFIGHPWIVTDINDNCLGIYSFSNSTDVKLNKQNKK